ncbi:MAG: DNA polymerase III subunit delta, partial [bacterium]
AVAQKNLKRALAFLGDLMSLGSNESYIVTMLHRQLRQIYEWKFLKKSGYTENECASELGLTPFTRKKLEAQVKNFPTKTLPFMICALIRADEEIKSSSLNGRFILEKLVVRLAG